MDENEILVYRGPLLTSSQEGATVAQGLDRDLRFVTIYTASVQELHPTVRGKECQREVTRGSGNIAKPGTEWYHEEEAMRDSGSKNLRYDAIETAIAQMLSQAEKDGLGTQIIGDIRVTREERKAIDVSGPPPRKYGHVPSDADKSYQGRLDLVVQAIGYKRRTSSEE